MDTFAPIETYYDGHLFRSRLEARWAVFFNALGIAWQYEVQGYHVGPDNDRMQYLPDFWLPDLKVWAEVKGRATERDVSVLAKAAYPAARGGLEHNTDTDLGISIVLLSDVPRTDQAAQPLHTAIYWNARDEVPCVGFVAWVWSHKVLQMWPLYTPWPVWMPEPSRLTYPATIDLGGVFRSRIFDAYNTARTARFEWGATP